MYPYRGNPYSRTSAHFPDFFSQTNRVTTLQTQQFFRRSASAPHDHYQIRSGNCSIAPPVLDFSFLHRLSTSHNPHRSIANPPDFPHVLHHRSAGILAPSHKALYIAAAPSHDTAHHYFRPQLSSSQNQV